MDNSYINDVYEIYGKKFKILIDKDDISKRVEFIAEQINQDYKDKKPIFLIVLKGGMFFASDLLRHIKLDCEIDAIRARSYGKSMKSSGNVLLEMKIEIENKDVIIIEDIVDTGLTLKRLIEKLQEMHPASIETAAFLSKPTQKKYDVRVKYIGFEIPSAFVIGYGLDYAEKGRHLPSVYSLID